MILLIAKYIFISVSPSHNPSREHIEDRSFVLKIIFGHIVIRDERNVEGRSYYTAASVFDRIKKYIFAIAVNEFCSASEHKKLQSANRKSSMLFTLVGSPQGRALFNGVYSDCRKHRQR